MLPPPIIIVRAVLGEDMGVLRRAVGLMRRAFGIRLVDGLRRLETNYRRRNRKSGGGSTRNDECVSFGPFGDWNVEFASRVSQGVMDLLGVLMLKIEYPSFRGFGHKTLRSMNML